MTVTEGVYQGAGGVEFVGDLGTYDENGTRTPIDLTGNTLLAFDVTKPSGATATWSASVKGAATDGYITYTCTSSDLDEIGRYSIQPRVEFGGSSKFYGRSDFVHVNKRGT